MSPHSLHKIINPADVHTVGGLTLLLHKNGRHEKKERKKACNCVLPIDLETEDTACLWQCWKELFVSATFLRLWTEGGTLQRPDGKICQANRAETLLLWVMTFCWIHTENMKGNSASSSPPPSAAFLPLQNLSLAVLSPPPPLDKAHTTK